MRKVDEARTTMSPQPDSGLFLANPDVVRRIRDVLARADYTEPRIREVLGVLDWPSFRRRRQSLTLFLHRTRADTPLNTFIRLFVLHQPVAVDRVSCAVQP